jgi:protein-S-isoprenylcysteine O-methyltransferase Ste14
VGYSRKCEIVVKTNLQVTVLWQFLYGVLFVLFLPMLLFEWAQLTGEYIRLPVVNEFVPGLLTAAAGGVITLLGIAAIVFYGEGLPMNAFPPKKYVSQGIFKLIPHPIYTGFTIFCLGCAMLFGSASGFWFVTPVVALSCVALVQGFEKHELARRFGGSISLPMLSLPGDNDGIPLRREVVSVYLLVFLPWLALYECVRVAGIPPDSVSAFLPFEKNIPIIEWTELIYAGTYVFVMLVPIIVRSAKRLREFAIEGLCATFAVTLVFFTVPLIATPREFSPDGFLGTMLLWERAHDTPAAAFPSFHVVWAFLAAKAYDQSYPRLRYLWWLIAILISASCITTGMHAIADVVGALLMVLFLWNVKHIWSLIRNRSELIANSWREWRFGPIRVINHGMYTGFASFLGLVIVGTIIGAGNIWYALIVSFFSLITAGLWAQFIEGSPRLLRPYGYYGGVLGAVFGAVIAWLLGGSFWLLLGAYSVAGPWIQAAGRLRCLVQGCCHGREASAEIGIRFRHPMSRVNKIAGLNAVPLHPTQVYSILWNIVCGIVLARIWSVHASLPLITGIYLILNGLGRFVEESYRGEPQTPIFGRMRLYQWMSVFSVVCGAMLTTIDAGVLIPSPEFNLPSVIIGFGFGLVTWFAQGVDFPNSNKRFARLA